MCAATLLTITYQQVLASSSTTTTAQLLLRQTDRVRLARKSIRLVRTAQAHSASVIALAVRAYHAVQAKTVSITHVLLTNAVLTQTVMMATRVQTTGARTQPIRILYAITTTRLQEQSVIFARYVTMQATAMLTDRTAITTAEEAARDV